MEHLTYNSENKTITTKYKIIGKTTTQLTIENLQEVSEDFVYMDGKSSGYSLVKTTKLPISQITIGETDENDLTEITLPYWLYKKDSINLEIKKLDHSIFRIKPKPIIKEIIRNKLKSIFNEQENNKS